MINQHITFSAVCPLAQGTLWVLVQRNSHHNFEDGVLVCVYEDHEPVRPRCPTREEYRENREWINSTAYELLTTADTLLTQPQRAESLT